jgi:hypothetical protein
VDCSIQIKISEKREKPEAIVDLEISNPNRVKAEGAKIESRMRDARDAINRAV